MKQFIVMVAGSPHHYPIASFGTLDAAASFVDERVKYMVKVGSYVLDNQGMYVVPVENEVSA